MAFIFILLKSLQNYAFGKNIKRVYEKYLKGLAPFCLSLEKTASLSKKAGSTFFREELYIAVHIYLVSSNPANHMNSNCCY